MSEPKLLNNTCPQCGGRLRVKKGAYFTFASCSWCNIRIAWSKDLKSPGCFQVRTVTKEGVRLGGHFYFDDCLLPYIGERVLIKARPFGVDVYRMNQKLICSGLPYEWLGGATNEVAHSAQGVSL